MYRESPIYEVSLRVPDVRGNPIGLLRVGVNSSGELRASHPTVDFSKTSGGPQTGFGTLASLQQGPRIVFPVSDTPSERDQRLYFRGMFDE